MNKLFIMTVLILSMLTACSSAPGDPASPNPEPAQPAQGQGEYIPGPADSALIRGNVYLDTTELLTMESFPLQFALHLAGNLPTPCDQLRISVNRPDTENKVDVDVYSVADPNTVCVQSLEPFDVNFSLGSYPSGRYFLYVNGTLVAEFEA